MEKTNFILVLVTTETFDLAKQIAKITVTEQLAACCTVVQNCYSIFGWQNTIQERFEALIFIKTTEDKFEALSKRVVELHSDEVPEIIALPIKAGLESYLNWIKQVLE